MCCVVQARIDALAPRVPGAGNATATLDSVCYKPLGDACATQSLLQVRHAHCPDEYNGAWTAM